MMAWELKQIIMRRMSDDGGGDCSIVTREEIEIFSFCLLQVKRCLLSL